MKDARPERELRQHELLRNYREKEREMPRSSPKGNFLPLQKEEKQSKVKHILKNGTENL